MAQEQLLSGEKTSRGAAGGGMNVLRKLALWTGSKMSSYGGGITLGLTDPRLGQWFGGGPTVTGHAINDESAMRITTAFACVRVIAETVGAVTLGVFERQKNGNAVKVDHDLGALLIESPNRDMDGLEYREAKATNLAARGNAYSLIERNGSGNVAALYPIQAARVTPKRGSDTNWRVVYTVQDRGKGVDYPPEKIWHWKGFGYDGLTGLSPIECARQSMGLALAGEEAGGRLFANGMTTSAVVSVPQWLKPDQREIARQNLAEMHAGLVNYGRPYLLEGGMKIEDGVFAPRDAQFLELRKFQIPELCRLWRISPHMIADLDRATNNNIEQLSLEFVMYTMLPYFRRIEEKARQLFTPADRSRFFLRFNFESLLRADSVARAGLYSILLQNGVYSRNEVRALENRNRADDDGMDDYTVQTNMTPVDKLAAIVAAQAVGKQQAPQTAEEAPAPEKSGDVQNVNVVLPAELKHQIAQSISVPGIRELADQVRRSNDENAAAIQSMVRALAEVKAEIGRDREAVFDSKGNAVGTRSVEKVRSV